MEASLPEATAFGQVIEYIEDRLFLASYTHAPTSRTPFLHAAKSKTKAVHKRSKSAAAASPQKEKRQLQPVYFSIDDSLLYNAFHADFGPLHIGHLYRFAVYLHEVLGDPKNEGKAVVFWSHADSRSRANAACVLACYMVLIQSWPPHLALAPIVQMDPPLMPFRDAGYSQADFVLNVQDVVYGVWKAKEEGLIDLKGFSLEEYEWHERVDMGDFNWVSPDFVAFASPQHKPVEPISPASAEYAKIPKTTQAILDSDLPHPFKQVLSHFKARRVGLVVRLNSELYSPTYFSAIGITHVDMMFDDGTCPALPVVKKFIRMAHDVITVKSKAVAVHCKAGLGRTGCLIGAYLIYRYGFTANEVIAYMRFMRPGMVVGPQQHWLHLNQGAFREWWFEDSIREKLALLKQSTPPRSTTRNHLAVGNSGASTPPSGLNSKRRALGELDYNDTNSRSVSASAGAVYDENLPAPTPGQPRKTSKLYGERQRYRTEGVAQARAGHDVVQTERSAQQEEGESDEEFQLRMLARKSTSRSPSGSHKKRAVSCTTTMTTVTQQWDICDDETAEQSSDSNNNSNNSNNNNNNHSKSVSLGRGSSGSGALSISRSRASPSRSTNGVRKTSSSNNTGTVRLRTGSRA